MTHTSLSPYVDDDLDDSAFYNKEGSQVEDSGDSGNNGEESKRKPFSLLRVVSDDYDQAQRVRVAKGEQIRAILQGKDSPSSSSDSPNSAPYDLVSLGYSDKIDSNGKVVKSKEDYLLESILRDINFIIPNPYLCSAYRRAYEAERHAYNQMSSLLSTHPAWPWMSRIRGIGPTLGAKLLSRLDLSLAHTPSSFWLYCGLSTVPGQKYECAKCGWVGVFPATFQVTGKHKGCKEIAKPAQFINESVRAAQPKLEKGQPRPYDSFAKKTIYLIVMSCLKSGSRSFYATHYRQKVAYYDRERIGWEKGRKHYSAIRVAGKLFLSHLHEAWSRAEGKEGMLPYSITHLGHDKGSWIGCDDVLEFERKKD